MEVRRAGSSQSFPGFLLRVVVSIPVWFILTALITYVALKVMNIEAPLIDAIISLNLNRLIEQNFVIQFPVLLLSGFVSLVIVWAAFWRG